MGAPRILAPTTISGGIPTAGAGTLNTVALWTPDGFTLGNSLLTQAGSVITNATGAIRANGTTQTTPAFMRYDATNSGIYFPATNEIGFTISNQHAMFISSGRLVGIGTVSPASALHVRNNTAGITLDSTLGGGRQYQLNPLRTGLSNSGFEIRDVTAGAAVISIDASQNVGIGTASPLSQFTLGGIANSTTKMGFQSVSTEVGSVSMNSATGEQRITAGFAAWGGFQTFYTNGFERARIDSSGNFGVGRVPSAWNTAARALELRTNALWNYNSGSDSVAYWTTNAFLNTSGVVSYKASAAASQYSHSGGAHIWERAVSGVAGNAVTWLESARIDSTGRLGIGLSPSTYILETATDASVYGVRVGRGAGAVSSNTAVGASALNANTSGTGNTAIGASSLSAVTTGTNNTMLGYVAGSGVSTGSSNTMIGFATASGGVTTGSDNTLVGAIAGNQITSGANNVCVGSNAGQTQTTASDNTYVGKNAGYFQLGSTNTAVGRSAMTGASGGASTNTASTAVGYLALQNVTSGNANTAIGSEAGNALTSNGENTFVGQQAGYFPTNGENTAIGRVAMRGISGSSTGSANTALGRAALYSFTTGIQNTALGRNAAFALSSGNNNVLIGERAAETLTTGSANIVIGRLATTAAATDSNQLVLGSATDFVATNGGATTYYATAGASLGYIQVRLNGANVKIQVFAP